MKRILGVGLLFAAGCLGRGNDVVQVTGQIEAVTVHAGSRVGGRVSEVLVEEGDLAKAGAVLVRIDPAEAEAMVAAAEAKLAQAEAALAKLEAGARSEQIRQAEAAAVRAEEQYRLTEKGFRSQEVKAARAAADAARAQRDEARAEYRRIEQLVASGAVSEQVYDRAKHACEAAEARYEAAREKFDLVAEGLRTEEIAMAKAGHAQALAVLDELRNGARPEDIAAGRAARAAAEANLARARVTADEMVITAPRDGLIESIDIHPGDLIGPGPVVSIIDPDDLELFVYVSAAMLGHLRVGQRVMLTTDSHGPETFEGTIAHIAAKGEFTPRNLQTTEERVQQVFGVKIKLDSAGGRLRAGMAATAHLPTTGPGAFAGDGKPRHREAR